MLVATTAAIGLWFRQANLALAMALVLSIARAGSYAADVSPTWAGWLYAQGWQPPLFLAAALAGTSLLAAIAYRWLAVRRPAPRVAPATGAAQERFKWRELLRFSRSYWYVLALCVLFYAVILPFRSTFAIKYLQHAHGLDLQAASTLNSYVFLTAVFATPLFGWLADRYGRRGLLLVAGSLLLPLVFLLLGTGGGSLWLVTALLGVSYSLVPAVLWPAVALMVESGRLGTAYGLMFMLQNLGLTVFNLVAGALNDAAGASAANAAGYAPMLVFFGTAAGVGTLFALALWRHERGPGGHGLEAPARAS
jgi:Na+/melibiose symporter-like transporter